MSNTQTARPGRPPKYGERLERIQLLVTPDQRKAAEREAKLRGVSISEVMRDWIDGGRK